jgi:DNA polymerase-1
MKITYVKDEATRAQFMAFIVDTKEPIAVDVETTGLNPWHDKLRVVQFGDSFQAFFLPFPDERETIQAGLSWPGVEYFNHNSKFDAQFLHVNGFVEWLMDDTKIMAHLIDPGTGERGYTGLKALSDRWVEEGSSDAEKALKAEFKRTKTNWATIPVDNPVYVEYSGRDPILTSRLRYKLAPMVKQSYQHLYDMEVVVWRALAEAERHGMLVDEAFAKAGLEDKTTEAAEVASRWEGLNLGSTPQLAKRLEAAGLSVPRTAKGNPSVDEAYLESLDIPLARDVLTYRRAQKVGSTYFKAFLDLRDERGYVHPTINPLGAKTGRMSCERPNLQNVPKGPSVRGSFIPSPGNVLVSADFRQIEYRIFAHFAQEREMIEAFLRGEDMHAVTARITYDDPDIDSDDPRRGVAKNANFAELFGAGVEQFAATAGIGLAEARLFKVKYHEAFPGIKKFTQQMVRYAAGNGMAVETAYGRRIPVERDRMYASTNYMIQGTAADVLKCAIVAISGTQWLQYFILPVHDETVFDVPEELAPQLIAELPGLMEVHDKFAVPLTIDVKVQRRWGTTEKE